MKWLKGKSTNFNQIELVNEKKGKYVIKLSPRPYTPVNTEDEEQEDTCDIEYVEVVDTGIQSVDKVKQHLLDVLKEYDFSDEVNVFYYNGKKQWIDVNKRNAIYHACELAELDGYVSYELWVDDVPVMLPISVVKTFLKDLERYAKLCYNATALHTADIKRLTNIKDILNYNICTGYPQVIYFNDYIYS